MNIHYELAINLEEIEITLQRNKLKLFDNETHSAKYLIFSNPID